MPDDVSAPSGWFWLGGVGMALGGLVLLVVGVAAVPALADLAVISSGATGIYLLWGARRQHRARVATLAPHVPEAGRRLRAAGWREAGRLLGYVAVTALVLGALRGVAAVFVLPFAWSAVAQLGSGRRVLVWFRRFGPDEGLDSGVVEAASLHGTLLTLVDRRVRETRGAPVGAAGLLAAIGVGAAIVSATAALRALGFEVKGTIVAAGSLALIAVGVALASALSERGTPRISRRDEIEPVVAAVLARAGRRWRWPWTSTVVSIPTDDAVWPLVARRLAEAADVVIVDATVPGEGLAEELRMLAELGREDALVLAEAGPGTLPAAIARDARLLDAILHARLAAPSTGASPRPPAPAWPTDAPAAPTYSSPPAPGALGEAAATLRRAVDRLLANPTSWGGATSFILLLVVLEVAVWNLALAGQVPLRAELPHPVTRLHPADEELLELALQCAAALFDALLYVWAFACARAAERRPRTALLRLVAATVAAVYVKLAFPLALSVFVFTAEGGRLENTVLACAAAADLALLPLRGGWASWHLHAVPTLLPLAAWVALAAVARIRRPARRAGAP